MAAPNLNAPVTITGKTAYLSPADTNEATLISNASDSGKAIRVTSLIATNTNGSGPADATVTLYSAAAGGTGYRIASTIAVPANSSVVLLSRDASIWLEENRRLVVRASAANYLTFVAAYEEAT